MEPIHYRGYNYPNDQYLNPDVVLYHGKCPDGIGSAWVYWNKDKNIKFIGVSHELNVLDNILDDIRNKNVVIVDFSFPIELLSTIVCPNVKTVAILDHHDTAYRNLKSAHLDDNIFNLFFYIDLTRSGAQITWDMVNPNLVNNRPYFIDYIGDRDLWKFELPCSKEFNMGLYNEGWITFEGLDILNMKDKRKELIKIGKTLLDIQNRTVAEIAETSILVSFNNYKVRIPNKTFDMSIRSEVGNKLSELSDCDFSATYEYIFTEKEWKISLRGSNNCKIKLNEIAEIYGGGGHPLACGFTYKDNIHNIFKNIDI